MASISWIDTFQITIYYSELNDVSLWTINSVSVQQGIYVFVLRASNISDEWDKISKYKSWIKEGKNRKKYAFEKNKVKLDVKRQSRSSRNFFYETIFSLGLRLAD